MGRWGGEEWDDDLIQISNDYFKNMDNYIPDPKQIMDLPQTSQIEVYNKLNDLDQKIKNWDNDDMNEIKVNNPSMPSRKVG